MVDPSEQAARLQELEMKFMEQQRQIEDLSDGIFAQQRVIDGLLKAVERLSNKVAGAPGLVDAGGDETPPHY